MKVILKFDYLAKDINQLTVQRLPANLDLRPLSPPYFF